MTVISLTVLFINLLGGFLAGWLFRKWYISTRKLPGFYLKKRLADYKELKEGDLIQFYYYEMRFMGVVIKKDESELLSVSSLVLKNRNLDIDMSGELMEILVSSKLKDINLLINFNA